MDEDFPKANDPFNCWDHTTEVTRLWFEFTKLPGSLC